MHRLFVQASEITHDVIGAAVEVHRDKGSGLLESIYEWCLTKELELRSYTVRSQDDVVVKYKQHRKQFPLKYDLLINDCLLVEAKAVVKVLPIHKAQLLSYMKLLDVPIGLLINFNAEKLTDGVTRMLLPGANLE